MMLLFAVSATSAKTFVVVQLKAIPEYQGYSGILYIPAGFHCCDRAVLSGVEHRDHPQVTAMGHILYRGQRSIVALDSGGPRLPPLPLWLLLTAD